MNYLIISPGRTGSVFLLKYIAFNLKKKIKFIQNEFTEDLSNHVIHTHNIHAVDKFKNHQPILVRRNPIEIAASQMIAEQTKILHFRPNKFVPIPSNGINFLTIQEYTEKYKETMFDLNLENFLEMVQFEINWYIKTENLLEKTIIFNYNEAISIDAINLRLNLNDCDISADVDNFLPVSQPWDKWTKINNADLLKTKANELFITYMNKYPKIFPKEDFI